MAIRIKIKFVVTCDKCKKSLGTFNGFVTSEERKQLEQLEVLCAKHSIIKETQK